jgi:hypothetical protein
MILLGWEIGTGKRVEIPETGHLAWFGQTQLSGKTTALEAIAYRGELRAVAFITKQGEGGFLTGRMIAPYFSEPTNDEEQPLWRWVKSILEAGQQRRMNFEESWIIRACEEPRQAETLAQVHANIRSLLQGESIAVPKGRGKNRKFVQKVTRKPVSGINAGVYTSLKAYFDIVMPQLARLPYTKKLALGDGLNVMDLREYAMETQALVIRSVMEWVYQHEKGVRVIVPEAQDFVPQGKNSPVKMACETLVRKAGANKNFMWLDSQDMAAVDKIMLRACSIVGIGVQTEGHEIERSLAGLFTPQLKPVDIARLKIGEFFVRTPEAKVSKVYVQPAWMESELHAQAIAKGEERVESARQMLRAFKDARGQGRKDAGKPHQLLRVQIQEPPDVEESESLPPVDGEPATRDQGADRTDRPGDTDGHVGADADSGAVRGYGGRPVASEPADVERSPAESDGRRDVDSSVADRGPDRGEFQSDQLRGDNRPRSGQVAEYSRAVASGCHSEEEEIETPTPILNESEPGKYETQPFETQGKPTQPGDHRIAGNPARTESASENPPLHEAVPGAPVRAHIVHDEGVYVDPDESENPMPKLTPAQIVTNCMNEGLIRGNPLTFEALRDLLKDHAALIEAHDALAARLRGESATAGQARHLEGGDSSRHSSAVPSEGDSSRRSSEVRSEGGNGHGLRFTVPDLDYIYQYVKTCAQKDPGAGILEILTHRPEIRVKVERQVIHANGNTLDGRVALLVHEGFFDKPKTRVDVGNELRRRGALESKANLKILSPRLSSLAEKGFLTIEGDAYKSVPEMKAQIAKA